MDRSKDDDYKAWEEGREANAEREFTGQDLRISVDVPGHRRFRR